MRINQTHYTNIHKNKKEHYTDNINKGGILSELNITMLLIQTISGMCEQ